MLALSIVTLSGGSAVALATGLASPAAAVSGTALINGDTVTGNPSVEQTIAASLGLSVTVASGTTWDSMTAADFAQYTVLIVGDPTCRALAPSVTSNRATWTSAVMATAGGNSDVGNRVVWGSAPVFHRTAHPGADKGISDGIAFAAALSPTAGHATGVYLDASCDGSYSRPNPALIDTLNMLSVGKTRPWTENPTPTCGGRVSFVGTAPQFADISTSDFAGWQCSVQESFLNFETDFVPLAIATDTRNAAVCGTDTTTRATTCGEAYYLAAGPGLIATDSEIAVSPLTATNPVNSTHTITATVKNELGPLVGQLVDFTVSGANAGASGTCVPVNCKSNSAGKVTFTYTGTHAGKDTITASIMCNPAIHTATAAKTWVTPTRPTEPPTTEPPTTQPPPTVPPGNIFQVELRKCTKLHVGYNRFAPGTMVRWNVTQGTKTVSTGQFRALGGGKKYHFLDQSLHVRVEVKATAHFHWVANATNFNYTAKRQPGC